MGMPAAEDEIIGVVEVTLVAAMVAAVAAIHPPQVRIALLPPQT
jgi:hypothetical protein